MSGLNGKVKLMKNVRTFFKDLHVFQYQAKKMIKKKFAYILILELPYRLLVGSIQNHRIFPHYMSYKLYHAIDIFTNHLFYSRDNSIMVSRKNKTFPIKYN